MSTTETVTITQPENNPSLEEQAAKAGINPETLDSTAVGQPAEVRPSWLPADFATPEDFAASYAEMKAKAEGKTDTPSDERTEQTEEPGETDATLPPPGEAEKAAKEAADKAGVNLQDLSKAYWETGSLTDEQYGSLEKAGYPKNLVDQFIQGQAAVRDTARNQVFDEVGGEESYGNMLGWASKNLSKPEIDAYNRAVEGDDPAARMQAVKGLKARQQQAVGFEPQRQLEGRQKASVSVYESIAQLQADMRDPRYKSDPAFRKGVEQKLDRSDIF